MSSIPLLEAPSISMTSKALEAVISLHDWHVLHVSKFSVKVLQIRAFATSLASVVFPVSLVPEKSYA